MSTVETVTLAFAALVLIAWYLTYTAARLRGSPAVLSDGTGSRANGGDAKG